MNKKGYLHDESFQGSGPASAIVPSTSWSSGGTYRMLDVPILFQLDEDCTANGFNKAFAACIALNLGAPYSLPSRRWTYWHSRRLVGMQGQDLGAYPEQVIEAVNDNGFPDEKFWEYEGSPFDPPPLLADQHAYDQRMDFTVHSIASFAELMALLSANIPCVWCGNVDQAFDDGLPSGDWDFAGASIGGHAMAMLGYRNGKPEVDNSWGTNWSLGGRCTIGQKTIENPASTLSMWAVSAVLRKPSETI